MTNEQSELCQSLACPGAPADGYMPPRFKAAKQMTNEQSELSGKSVPEASRRQSLACPGAQADGYIPPASRRRSR